MNRKGTPDPDRRSGHMRTKTKVPPEPIVRLGLAIIRGMHWLENLMVPAPMRVADLAFGSYSLAEVIRTAAAMGIADKLATGPMTAQALANKLGADPERLYRLMRFATVHGLFKASRRLRQGYGPETTKFSNNALSACLREDHPNCQKHAIMILVGKQFSAGWQELEWGVRTGGRIFEKIYGEPLFERCMRDMSLEDVFSKAMSEIDCTCGNSILQDYTWAKYDCYIDVAGAYGSFLASLLIANPKSTGVLFDQPQVIARAMKLWLEEGKEASVARRTTFTSGDFFKPETLPSSQKPRTAWILRQICHDWPETEVVQILSSVRTAMEASAQPCTLCLVEAVITSKGSPDYRDRARTASDLHMMISLDGKERDAQQWADVLARAGFKLTRVVSTRSIFSVVEATPVPFAPAAEKLQHPADVAPGV